MKTLSEYLEEARPSKDDGRVSLRVPDAKNAKRKAVGGNISWHDVKMSRYWAENTGDKTGDNALDLFEYKMLELFQARHASSAQYHERQDEEIQAARAEIEQRFNVDEFVNGDDGEF